MRAEQVAGVLGPQIPLDHRLEEVTHRGDGGHCRTQNQCVHSGKPVLVETGAPDPSMPIRNPPISPSIVLFGERFGANLWLPNIRPTAGPGVTGEGADKTSTTRAPP